MNFPIAVKTAAAISSVLLLFEMERGSIFTKISYFAYKGMFILDW